MPLPRVWLAVLFFTLTTLGADAATFIVNSAADGNDGTCDATHCTLREAINAANATPGADSISFNIAPGGMQTIATSGLPSLGEAVTIDGTTQPGGSGGPGIRIAMGDSLMIVGNGVVVRGLVLSGPGAFSGVVVTGSGVSIAGNYIGTDATGLASEGFGAGIVVGPGSATIGGEGVGDGNVISGNEIGIIAVSSVLTLKQNLIGLGADGSTIVSNVAAVVAAEDSNWQIGGSSAAARNVISGNQYGINSGFELGFSGPASVTVIGNYIGTDASGTLARPNDLAFSAINATFTIVDNVISGNRGAGLTMGSATAVVRGNRIGTNAAGTAALPNGVGITIAGGSTTIGGTGAGEGNLISGNTGVGIQINSGAITFQGNRVGTDASGSGPLGNGGDGVYLGSGVSSPTLGGLVPGAGNVIASNGGFGINVNAAATSLIANRVGAGLDGITPLPNVAGGVRVAASGVTIGGASAAEGNIIRFNGGPGVFVQSGSGTAIRSNSIGSNGSLGIDLAPAGVSPNDSGDGDAGANELQNAPVITSAIRASSGTTALGGILSSAPGATFAIDVYASSTGDASGYGEGERLIGTTSVTTNGAGEASFALSSSGVLNGEFVTATATNAANSTSEFSNALAVTTPGSFQFTTAFSSVAEGGGVANVTITRVGGSSGAASVDMATADGTASGGDYIAAVGTVSFADGELSKTIPIAVADDALDEPDETFSVSLSNPTGGAALGAPFTTTVTILDDDPLPALSVTSIAAAEGDSGASAFSFTVALSATSGRTVSVGYATADQTATAGSDYVAQSGTLTFLPGETAKIVDILVNGDIVVEANEVFFLNLLTPVNATVGAPGSGTLTNDDGPPQLTIDDVVGIEGNAGTSVVTFAVTLAPSSATSVTVGYATADGSATAGTDYTAASGVLTFSPGETRMTIGVSLIGDTLVEPNETFVVNLSGAAGATIADAQGGGTIADDDGSPLLTINDVAASEGAGTAGFTVTLAPASATTVTVAYATAAGTATADEDFATNAGSLTFLPGETSKSIAVPIVSDAIAETSETFSVTLSGQSGATIADPFGVGTIIDDDGMPQMSIGDVGLLEGAGDALLTVTLSPSSASTVTVSYATADGTATGGADYSSRSGIVTFVPGETSQTIAVPVTADSVAEPTETFTVALTGATGATITRPQATVAITDDDSAPALSVADLTVLEGNAGTTMAAFTVSLSGATAQTVVVSYATANGTASAGSDYVAASGQLTFAPGTTTRTVDVAVIGDVEVEGNETFALNLTSASNAVITGALARAAGTATIRNDDFPPPLLPPPPAPVPLLISDVTTVEGDSGMHEVFVTLSLTRAAEGAYVRYHTIPDTATEEVDYQSVSGIIVFAAGETTRTIAVPILGDLDSESAERFFVRLSAPSGVELVRAEAIVTITDDDAIVPTRAIVPLVGTARGAAGSNFRTSLQLINPTERLIAGSLLFRPIGVEGPASDVSFPYAIAPGENRSFADVQEIGASGVGTLEIRTTDGALPIAAVRVFNDAGPSGTAGFMVRALLPEEALAAGSRALLVGPSDPVASRFNIGVRSLDAGATVSFAVRSAAGDLLRRASYAYPPNFLAQGSAADVTGGLLRANEYVTIEIVAGDAIVYGTWVDNTTNDPSLQLAERY